MDIELVLIFAFVVTLSLILFRFVTGTHKRANEHEERKLELLARAEEAKSGRGGSDFRKLEERVRVLERIATDSNHALASQIEQLRDLQELDTIEDRQEVAR